MSNLVIQNVYEMILENFEKNTDISRLIALTLRDIFLNDILYISTSKRWFVYKSKKWQTMNKYGMKRKIYKLSVILSALIERAIDVDLDNDKKKQFIKKIMKLNKVICSETYDYEKVEKECIPLFSA